MALLDVGLNDKTGQGVDTAVRNIDRLLAAVDKLDKGIDGTEKDLDHVAKTSGSAFGSMRSGFESVTGAVFNLKTAFAGLAGAAGLGLAVRESLAFSTAMAEISTLLPAGSKDVDTLTKNIRELGIAYGGNLKEESRAAYQIISAGASNAAQVMDVLTVSNKLAIGGVTSVAIAADGLTSTLNAYGIATKDAMGVSDAMFVAMKAGKTTIAELSGSLGAVAPLAAQTGVGIDQLLASVSSLTKGGISTNVAMTGMRAILAAVVKPSSEASKEAAALGIEFNAAGLKAKGLALFLQDLTTRTGGSTEKLATLFGGVEAIVPALALTGKASKDFADILEAMGTRAGSTEEALTKMMASPQKQMDRFKGMITDLEITLGDSFVDGVMAAKTELGSLEDTLKDPAIAKAAQDIGVTLAGAVISLLAALKDLAAWKEQNPDLFGGIATTAGMTLAGGKVGGVFGAGVGALAGAGDALGGRAASDSTDQWVHDMARTTTGLGWLADVLEWGKPSIEKGIAAFEGAEYGPAVPAGGGGVLTPPPSAAPGAAGGGGGRARTPGQFDTAMADFYEEQAEKPLGNTQVDDHSQDQYYLTNAEQKKAADAAKLIEKDKADALALIGKQDYDFQRQNAEAIAEAHAEGADAQITKGRQLAENMSRIGSVIGMVNPKVGAFVGGVGNLAGSLMKGDIVGSYAAGIGLVTQAMGGSRQAHFDAMEAIQAMADKMRNIAENALETTGKFGGAGVDALKVTATAPMKAMWDAIIARQQESLANYRAEFGEEATKADWGPDPDAMIRINAMQTFFRTLGGGSEGGTDWKALTGAVEEAGFRDMGAWQTILKDLFGVIPLEDVGKEFFNLNDVLEETSTAARKLVADFNPVANSLKMQFQGESLAAQSRFGQAYSRAGGDTFAQREAYVSYQAEIVAIKAQMEAAVRRFGGSDGAGAGAGAAPKITTADGAAAGGTIAPPAGAEAGVEVSLDALAASLSNSALVITPEMLVIVAGIGVWDTFWSHELLGRIGGSEEGGFAAQLTEFRYHAVPAHRYTMAPGDVLAVADTDAFDALWSRQLLGRIGGSEDGGFAAQLTQFRTKTVPDHKYLMRSWDVVAVAGVEEFDGMWSRQLLGRIGGSEKGGFAAQMTEFRFNAVPKHKYWMRAWDVLEVAGIEEFDGLWSRDLLGRIGGSEKGGFPAQMTEFRFNAVPKHKYWMRAWDVLAMPFEFEFKDMYSKELLPRLAGGPGSGQFGKVLLQHRENVNAHKIPFSPSEFMTIPSGLEFFNFWWEQLYPAMNYASYWTGQFLPLYMTKINLKLTDIINLDTSGMQERLVAAVLNALGSQRNSPLVSGRAP